MDGVLLDLRQKRPDQENRKKENNHGSGSLKIALNEWQGGSRVSFGFIEGQKMCLKCPDCGKSFSHSSSLKRHSRTHTGVRPFVCSVCSKGFHYKNNLQDHARTHTGEKPFKCPDCGQSFAQSSTLNRHIGTHGKDKSCHICGKAFMKLSLLQEHFSIHVGKKECALSDNVEKLSSKKEVDQKEINVRLNEVDIVEENESPENHTLFCYKCGLKFKEIVNFQQHLWTHVGEGQALLYELAALNGLFNMYELLKQGVSQSRGRRH